MLLLPLLGLVGAALLVLNPLGNPGPLLFAQERVGRHGRSFTLWKFRTMRPGAGRNARFATDEAHRVTWLGRILRRHRLDELPQIVNVLHGSMSFVGPRPEQPALARRITGILPSFPQRLAMRPGLTGLAQVELGYAATPSEQRRRLDHDLRYIRTASWRADLEILKRTVGVVLRGAGAV